MKSKELKDGLVKLKNAGKEKLHLRLVRGGSRRDVMPGEVFESDGHKSKGLLKLFPGVVVLADKEPLGVPKAPKKKKEEPKEAPKEEVSE